ncbi:MAG: alpha amylase catalytic subunit, partial [Spirochaetales bacterium]|nr:alpha amylase catalytic subunit [Spirochaetales bacterium]
MKIKTGNDPGVNVKKNFKISFKEAKAISLKTNLYLEKNNSEFFTTPSGIYAVNLIGQIIEYIFSNYTLKDKPDVFVKTKEYADQLLGAKSVEKVINTFSSDFSTYKNPIEELIVLRLTNENPACTPYLSLFDEHNLISDSLYLKMMENCFHFLKNTSGPEGKGTNIIDFLKEPGRHYPESLLEQLLFMAENWKFLPEDYFQMILRGIDYIKEENKPVFPPGPGSVEEYKYSGDSPEGFSTDSEWMPNVVMMAKSTLVWLDQLSKQYSRSIERLDQIPDKELDTLADRGFSTLWLIGLWERSSASKQIKQSCGNPEAESSAYSLKRYEIASELGGWEALNNLKNRCRQRGIKLASDMVPNHTGIDSDWINEHPDWFIQLPFSPYPNYSYTGQNLSSHSDIGIYIEDHYYDQTDAAVTFKRVDFKTGRKRYIYHGNDGTSMPWNDTAQLDYLNPETREAIIKTILHVAKNFPVIRFDAAMTLAKKHIQRLWYPEPGMGGDIPTRSERGITRENFDKAIPVEFWREVVERIQKEAPDTLLLA